MASDSVCVAVTTECECPSAVTTDHISVEFDGATAPFRVPFARRYRIISGGATAPGANEGASKAHVGSAMGAPVQVHPFDEEAHEAEAPGAKRPDSETAGYIAGPLANRAAADAPSLTIW
jgi:hypothetical protein